jgi:diaminopimelate epimerase
MRFSKYHGIKNDFVLIGDPEGEEVLTPELIVALCDRRAGVGADGVIRIVRGPVAASMGLAGAEAGAAAFFMDHYNADGSPAEMCGNGIRCLAAFAYDRGLTSATELDVMTRAGMKRLKLDVDDGRVRLVTVDMGRPVLDVALIPFEAPGPDPTFVSRPFEAAGRTWTATAVSMGNPHIVLQLDADEDLVTVELDRIGPAIEWQPEFPRGTNVEFVKVVDGSIHMRVWERGVGETAACGTGACAALVACSLAGLCPRTTDVHLPGGTLRIAWDDDGGAVTMTGPATWVFDGDIPDGWPVGADDVVAGTPVEAGAGRP